MGCHFLLHWIFPTQGLNLCLLSWQLGSLPLSRELKVALLFLSSPWNYRANAFSHFRVIMLWKICFSIQKIVELLFFFIADNSKLVWFHDINLGTYEVQRTLPCLEPKERNLYFLFSIFMKTVFFPFSWMMYTFNIPGGKCQWYASHNKRKSKEMQLQGTRNFIIFSVKCPEENLILKITGTLRRRQEYIERFVTLKINLILNLSGSWAFFSLFLKAKNYHLMLDKE